MAPNVSIPTGVLHETDNEVAANELPPECAEPDKRKLQLVWRNIILMGYLHIAALYGAYLMFASARMYTSVLGKLCRIVSTARLSWLNVCPQVEIPQDKRPW